MTSLQFPETSSHLILRKAAKNDNQAVVLLILTVLREFGMDFDPKYDQDFDNFHQHYRGKNDLFLIAEKEGKIVGSCAIKEIEPGVGEVKRMYLLSEERGKGIGTKLLDKVLAFADEHSYHKLTLFTDSIFQAAIHLYSSRGFEISKQEKGDIYMEKICKH